MSFHSTASLNARHPIHNWEYADASARTGASGFVAADIGKVALQLDDGSFWVLRTTTPSWDQVSGAGGAPPGSHASTHQHGGGDEVATATAGANAIPKADGTGKLDAGWLPSTSVIGPGSSTDDAVARWDGVTGALLQDSGWSLTDLKVLRSNEGHIEIYDAAGTQILYSLEPAGDSSPKIALTSTDGNEEWNIVRKVASTQISNIGTTRLTEFTGLKYEFKIFSLVGTDWFRVVNSDDDVVAEFRGNQEVLFPGLTGDALVSVDSSGKLETTSTLADLNANISDATLDDSGDSRTPTAHATSHQHSGTDEIATATAAANAIPKADGTGKLDAGWIPVTSSANSAFVLQPGGSAGGNIFTDWASLYAALNSVNGPRRILFDDSLGVISIPAGTYNMQDVDWYGSVSNAQRVIVTVVEGVVFQKLRRFWDFLTVDFTGSTPPMTDFSGTDIVQARQGVILQCSGSGPLMQVSVTGPGTIMGLFLLGAQMTNNGNAVFDVNHATGFGFIGSQLTGTIGANTISGLLGSICQVQVDDTSSNLRWDHAGMAGTILPKMTYAQFKSGEVLSAAFSGSPFTASVTFTNFPYIDDQYHISLGIETTNNVTFVPTFSSRTATGFTIELNSSDKTDLVRVTWGTHGRYPDPSAI